MRLLEGSSRRRDYEDLRPTGFVSGPDGEGQYPEYPWVAKGPEPKDFLGNEFLLWLWHEADARTSIVGTEDAGDVTIFLDHALDLDCAYGQTGKDTIRGDGPSRSPEARDALRVGKAPRKAGLILHASPPQFDFTLNAATLGVGSAKLPEVEDADPPRPLFPERISLLRELARPDNPPTVIAAGDPDYLFLQEVPGKRLPDIHRQLGGKLSASTYYPLQNLPDADNDLGNAILSKFPLENGRPIPNHMKGACGVWAVSVIDGRRFYVACMRRSGGQSDERAQEMKNLTKAWQSQERPPIIAAVDGDLPDIDELLRLDSQGKWLASNHWSGKKSKTQDEMDQIEVVGKGGTSSKR